MTSHAAGSFEITEWTEDRSLDEGGDAFVRTRVRKDFAGELTGTSTADLVMVHLAGDPVAYVGFERLTATVGGREGTFVLQHVAGVGPDGPSATWLVVPGSGGGGLAGISGTARIEQHEDGSHAFTLDYDLAGATPSG